jgi:chemotaxis protein methyltransferase CheR
VFAKGNRLFPHSARMLVGLGVTCYARGSYDQAVDRLRAASDLNPDDPVPYQFLGKIEVAEAAPSRDGEETLSRYARLHSDSPEANYYCAVSVWKLRRGPEDRDTFVRVESLLEKAVRLDPKLGPAYLQLGILYAERKDLAKAISAYESAISATPRLAQAHYRLAQAYRQNGETGKAQQELERYQRISREADQQIVRERREIQQFVYTLRDRPATSPP